RGARGRRRPAAVGGQPPARRGRRAADRAAPRRAGHRCPPPRDDLRGGHDRHAAGRRRPEHPAQRPLLLGADRVSLGTAGLETGLSHLAASGDLPTITVADTRPADPGWSLTAEVSDFRAGAAVLEGRHLGVTPRVLSAAPTQEVTAGEPVAPGEGFTEGTTLASAAPGGGRGTTTVGGELLLHAPTSTVPGDYVARVTVTVS